VLEREKAPCAAATSLSIHEGALALVALPYRIRYRDRHVPRTGLLRALFALFSGTPTPPSFFLDEQLGTRKRRRGCHVSGISRAFCPPLEALGWCSGVHAAIEIVLRTIADEGAFS